MAVCVWALLILFFFFFDEKVCQVQLEPSLLSTPNSTPPPGPSALQDLGSVAPSAAPAASECGGCRVPRQGSCGRAGGVVETEVSPFPGQALYCVSPLAVLLPGAWPRPTFLR